MEVNRGGMQAQQHGSRFHRAGGVAVVLLGEFDKAELVIATHFPQEFGVQLPGCGLGPLQQFAGGGLVEAHQDVIALELETLAVGGFHLEGGVVVGQDGAGLESTVLFKEQIHGEKPDGENRRL